MPRRDKRMSLGQHLIELRKRLMIAALALDRWGWSSAFLITDPVLKLITEPIRMVAESRGDAGSVELMFSTVTSGFDLKLRMSFAIGLLISAPFWMWQIWAFIMPGLTRKEIRYTVGFLAAAIPLFFAGCWAGLVVMPHIVELMASFVPHGAAAFYDARVLLRLRVQAPPRRGRRIRSSGLPRRAELRRDHVRPGDPEGLAHRRARSRSSSRRSPPRRPTS